MSSIAPTICALCDGPLNKDDLAGEHGACHACRTANTKPTLARVSLLLSLKDDLSKIPGWDIVREIAGNTYGNQRSDKELLERIVGCMQTITGKSRGAILVLPLERVASTVALNQEIQRTRDSDPECKEHVSNSTKRKHPYLWKAESMLLVNQHPDWSDKRIAQEVSISPSSLSRCKEYQLAAAMARNGHKRHRGHISVDPESGLRDVEAYSSESFEGDCYD